MSHPEITKPEGKLLLELKATTCGNLLLSRGNLVVRTLVRKGYLEAMGTTELTSKVDRFRLTEAGKAWDPSHVPLCPLCSQPIRRLEHRVMVRRNGQKQHAHALCSREARSQCA